MRPGRLAAVVLAVPLVLAGCGGGGVDRAAIIADTEAQLGTMGMPDDVKGCVTAEINKLDDAALAAIDTNEASTDAEDGFKRAVLLCMKGYLVDETQAQLASSGASDTVQACVGDYINGLSDDALSALVLDGSADAQSDLQSAVLECMTSG